jgi:hypothetical protein
MEILVASIFMALSILKNEAPHFPETSVKVYRTRGIITF